MHHIQIASTRTRESHGAVLLPVLVQGASGVIPAHLSERWPDEICGVYPGVTDQVGNLYAASNLPLQASIAASRGCDGGKELASVTMSDVLTVALIMAMGRRTAGRRGRAPGGTTTPGP